MKHLTLILSFVLFSSNFLFGQNTVGLLSFDPSQSYDGYNLLYPHNQPTVFIINHCGEIVHRWDDEDNFRPGNTSYIRTDGTLVKTKRDMLVTDDAIWAGGGGETVEIRDWNNNLMWSYTLNDDLRRLHHDIEPMPNGNILMIAWELKTKAEAIQAGRDSTTLDTDELWPDYILEINPMNNDIVWEWHAWDHLIQDFDSTKDNFGVVADQPGLININYDNNGVADWLHCNSIDYLQERDQILLSVPFFNEVWVIDHSTTTEEAAGHTGGIAGKGGDLIYRWGNPAAYDQGTVDDQKLFNNHDAHWVEDFVSAAHPHFNKIAVFNNQVGADFSTANVVAPSWDMYDWAYGQTNNVYAPTDFDVIWDHPTPTSLYSTGLSSVQLLPNGNTLICSGRFGYTFELTPDDQIVWEYKTPLMGPNVATQGDTLVVNNNLTFQMKRFPINFDGFSGKDLTPQGYIELEPNVGFCDQILPTSDIMDEYFLEIYPNPANTFLTLEWIGGIYADVQIYDMVGRHITSFTETGGRKYLDISQWDEGVYFIEIGGIETRKLVISR